MNKNKGTSFLSSNLTFLTPSSSIFILLLSKLLLTSMKCLKNKPKRYILFCNYFFMTYFLWSMKVLCMMDKFFDEVEQRRNFSSSDLTFFTLTSSMFILLTIFYVITLLWLLFFDEWRFCGWWMNNLMKKNTPKR